MADPTIVSGSAVSGAYRTSLNLKAPATAELAEAEKPSFAAMVREATTDAVENLRESDAVARQGMAGEVSTQQVVEATIALESTVKVAVAMRDKLVAAYQEVLRMPI